MNELVYVPRFEIEEIETVSSEPSLRDRVRTILHDYDPTRSKIGADTLFLFKAFKVLGIDLMNYDTGFVLTGTEDFKKLALIWLSLDRYSERYLNDTLLNEWNLAVNDHDGSVIMGERSLYSVYQNIHGDVTLSRTLLSEQTEFFQKDWESIVDAPVQNIRAYQETTALVGALLVAYKKGKGDTTVLTQMLNSLPRKPRGCNAADAGTKEEDINFLKHYFEGVGDSDEIGISIFSGGNTYLYSKYESQNNALLIYAYSNKTRITVLEIPVIDIPRVLSMLCIFSGRSGNAGSLFIDWYVNTFGEQHMITQSEGSEK